MPSPEPTPTQAANLRRFQAAWWALVESAEANRAAKAQGDSNP